MNASKIARMESGLNGMAKKVLAAVPMQEAWTLAQINFELRRVGTRADQDVIEGCLGTLTGNGLVKQPSRGTFIRVTAPPKEPQTTKVNTVQHLEPRPTTKTLTVKHAPQPPDTLTRLVSVAASLRELADEIDSLALDVEERVQVAGKDGEKLRQLQSLLKSISGN